MDDEAEETTVLPLSLAAITALFRTGEHLHNALSERELWAICKECCSALQSVVESRSVDDLRLCPQSLILNSDGNITVSNSGTCLVLCKLYHVHMIDGIDV